MRIRSVFKHSAQALAEGSLVALLVVGLMAGSVLAAKPESSGQGKPGGGGGKPGGGGSATIVVPDGIYAQTTTATVTPAGLWVYASCSQSGREVYAQYVRSDAAGAAILTLGPTSFWSSGSASCYANAGSFSVSGQWSTAGSTTFSVAGS